jgi:hypothetical protein
VSIIYLAAGLSKLQGSTWWTGTAMWNTVANYEFAPLHLAFYHSLLTWLCGHRWLWELLMSGGCIFTLIVEIGLPFQVWNQRLRWVMIGGAVLLHAGIGVVMGLTSFQLMMMILLLSFFPAVTVRRFVRILPELPGWFLGRTGDAQPPVPVPPQPPVVLGR